MSKTELFVRKQAGGMFSVVDESMTTGNIWWVDSGSASGADAAGYGQNPDGPCLTLDYAIGLATANNGDSIFVMPGHAETKSAAGSLWALDQAGIKVIGLGNGADRPTFTFSHTGAVTTISAASCWLENVVFVCGVDSVVAPLTISAADCTLKNVEFRSPANVEFITPIITTAAADRLTLDSVFLNGDGVTGNACTIGVALIGTDQAHIKDSRFQGIYSTAAINFKTTKSLGVVIEGCVFENVGTALSKDIVESVVDCTFSVSNCFDMVGGYGFSGSDTAALASDDASAIAAAVAVVDGLHDVPTANAVTNAVLRDVVGNKTDAANSGAVAADKSLVAYAKQAVTYGAAQARCVAKTDGSVTNPSDGIFTVAGGPVLVTEFYGIVTTEVGAGASTCTITHTATAGGATALSTAVDIDGDVVGTSYHMTVATPGVFTPVTAGTFDQAPAIRWFLPIGAMTAAFSVTRAGVIAWYMSYVPLSPASVVTATA